MKIIYFFRLVGLVIKTVSVGLVALTREYLDAYEINRKAG